MDSTLGKILVFIGILLSLGALGFVIYTQHQLSVQNTAIQTEQLAQRQLIDGVVRAQTTWATKQDVTALIESNGINAAALAAIQADMSAVKATLNTANVVTVNSQAQNTTSQPSTGTGPANPTPPTQVAGCPSVDPFGFMKAQQTYTLNEQFGKLQVPFGTVGFSAFQAQPWSVNVLAREYTVDNVIGTDEDQRNVVYNQVNIKEGNNTYTLPITSSTTKQIFPTAKFSFWNPRLLLGTDAGFNLNTLKGEVSPNINLGIMSYGQYKTTPDLSILEVGVSYQAINKTAAVTLTPVSYNIGKNWFSPLMTNTYVGPSISYGTDGKWTPGLGLRVSF
jgi:hypothetical protein